MEIEQLEHLASLIGEPIRTKILWSLLDGKAYTATELSIMAGATPQNASMHLGKLVQANLLKVDSQGRHRNYSFARDEVAYAIEAMANLVPVVASKQANLTKDMPIRYCRSCYDHLAGKVGVLLSESLLNYNYIEMVEERYDITKAGWDWLSSLKIDTQALQKIRRPLVKPCLDWSERRYHIAGALGAVLLSYMLEKDWVRRISNSREIMITSKGRSNLYDLLGLSLK
jgi:DNA-binding transcriptional ArsR family regulator